MERVAWLGTGLLGSGFVEALLGRGVEVDAWNRTQQKAQTLAARGAHAHVNAEDAVRTAARVHLCLSDDAAVDGVLARIRPVLGAGVIVIDHSTVAPESTARRAETLRDAGVAFLHAPVFMAPENARTSTGLMLCSGPAAVFERAKEALSTMSGRVLYLGERPDKAAAYKLFGNAMAIVMTAGMADVIALARATGIDPVDALGVFKDFPVEKQIEGRGGRMARGDFKPAFELTMARKDVRLMLETARALPLPLCVLPAVRDRMDVLIAEGHGGLDMCVLAHDAFGQAVRRGRMRAP